MENSERLRHLIKAYLNYTKNPTHIYIMNDNNTQLQTELILNLAKSDLKFKKEFITICDKFRQNIGDTK